MCGSLTDLVHKNLKKRYRYSDDSKGLPGFRIPLMITAAFIVPCGIFLHGWSAKSSSKPFRCCLGSAKHGTLLATNLLLFQIVAVLFVSGSIISYLCTQMHIVTYTHYAASASAASTFSRSLAVSNFPLFMPYSSNYFGYGWGSSTLGLVAIVLGILVPFLFWRYGATLRARNPFAAGG